METDKNVGSKKILTYRSYHTHQTYLTRNEIMMDQKLIPAAASNMLPWVLKALQDGPSDRDDLFEAVVELARNEGFTATNILVLKSALKTAKQQGKVINVRKGWWKLAKSDDSLESKQIEGGEEDSIRFGRKSITALRTIGSGSQLVYLLYSKPHAEIAKRDGRMNWLCKIGMTKVGIGQRMFNGGSNTFVSEEPIIGLVIRCDDASSVETVLHKSLRVAGRWIRHDTGVEWFTTSPQQVESFYRDWLKACYVLKNT